MSKLAFWKDWYKGYQAGYLILLFLFSISICFALFALWWGSDFIISWEVSRVYKPLVFAIDQVDLLFSSLPVPVEHYIVSDVFKGSTIAISPGCYIVLAVLSLLFISVLSAIVSAFSRLWYLAGMAIIALGFLGLRLEQLMLFNRIENIGLYASLLIYFPLSYYFHAIKPQISLNVRILSFLVASLMLGFLFQFAAQVHSPFLYIGSYGILVPLALLLVFIITVGHDILSAFLYLITSGNSSQSKNSLQHFLSVSAIYLGWVLITFLHNIHYLHWDIIYLNPTLLLSVSAIVGVWGFRYRCKETVSIFPFAPIGAWLYLLLGIISFVTLGMVYLLANDPLIAAIGDAIIFGHLGVGLMFFLYIIGNFIGVLQQNLNVYKILYRPKNLPYFTTPIGGVIIVAVLVARAQLFPYYQALSGYYNGYGDLFYVEKEYFLSEEYYKLARSYEFSNHRSNYALASLASIQGDKAVALKYYSDALRNSPDEYAYVNLSNIYNEKGRFFDALFTLRQGLEKFPESARIKNNMGVLFSQTSVVDSADYYLERAALDKEIKVNAEVNLLGLITENSIPVNKDSLKLNFAKLDYLPLRNNTLVNLNLNEISVAEISKNLEDFKKKGLNSEDFTFWYEYAINQVYSQDTADMGGLLNEIAKDSLNAGFEPELTFSMALYNYYHGKIGKAFKEMKDLVDISTSKTGDYYYILGLWAIQQNAFPLAADYLKKAEENGNKNYAFPLAVAITASPKAETDKLGETYWNKVTLEGTQTQKITRSIVQELGTNNIEQKGRLDSLYFADLYLSNSNKIEGFYDKVSAIKSPSLQTEAWLLAASKAIKAEDFIGVKGVLDLLASKNLDFRQQKKLSRLQLLYALKTTSNTDLEKVFPSFLNNSFLANTPEMLLLKARMQQIQGHLDQAAKSFVSLAKLNPFFEEGQKEAAGFFQNAKEEEKAYKILLDALDMNPYSTTLQKAYILQCLDMQLFSYAEMQLTFLKENTFKKDYEDFSTLYKTKRDSVEMVQDQWQ